MGGSFACCFFPRQGQSNRVQPGKSGPPHSEAQAEENESEKEKLSQKPRHSLRHKQQAQVGADGGESANAGAHAAAAETGPARRFRLQELQTATGDFDESLVLGEGGFGKVYRGKVDGVPGTGGTLDVAVKKLNPESIQGYEQWVNEVLLLERLRHPNLVRLLGYCAEDGEALLVYTLYPRGSLDKALFEDAAPGAEEAGTALGVGVGAGGTGGGSSGAGGNVVLTWQQRVQVALDAARGLQYLHGCCVIHRDFKPSNILLSFSGGVASVLTDFGTARVGPNGADTDAHISTRIMGTLGYLDPLYLETGRLTYRSDIFAFGVMLLELLTGKREGVEQLLSSWVRQWEANQTQDDIVFHVDWRLKGQYSRSAACRLALLASRCVSVDQSERPEIQAIVEELQALQP